MDDLDLPEWDEQLSCDTNFMPNLAYQQQLPQQAANTSSSSRLLNNKTANGPPTLPAEMPAASSSANKENARNNSTENNYSNNIMNTVFEAREFLLYSIDRIKKVTEIITDIDETITSTGDLEGGSVVKYSNSLKSITSTTSSFTSDGIREISILDNQMNTLLVSLSKTLNIISTNNFSKKNMYLSQLKKMRELSNLAIRNALQSERNDMATTITRVKEQLIREKDSEKDVVLNQLYNSEEQIKRLKFDIHELQSQLKTIQGQLLDKEGEHIKAISEALRLQREQFEKDKESLLALVDKERVLFEKEKEQIAKNHSVDLERVRDDGVSTTESTRRHLLSQLDNQKKLHDEMMDMMKTDIQKLHANNDKLKEDFSREHEYWADLMKQEKLGHEADITSHREEAKANLSKLRHSYAEQIKVAKEVEVERNKELEEQLERERENHLKQQIRELEMASERHKADIKRVSLQYNNILKQEVAKLNHMHRTEVNRLLRDNDRMKRLLSRQLFESGDKSKGGADDSADGLGPEEGLGVVNSDSGGAVFSSSHVDEYAIMQALDFEKLYAETLASIDSAYYGTLTGITATTPEGEGAAPAAASSRGRRRDPEPSSNVPKPTESSWGALGKSIALQEKGSLIPKRTTNSSNSSISNNNNSDRLSRSVVGRKTAINVSRMEERLDNLMETMSGSGSGDEYSSDELNN